MVKCDEVMSVSIPKACMKMIWLVRFQVHLIPKTCGWVLDLWPDPLTHLSPQASTATKMSGRKLSVGGGKDPTTSAMVSGGWSSKVLLMFCTPRRYPDPLSQARWALKKHMQQRDF